MPVSKKRKKPTKRTTNTGHPKPGTFNPATIRQRFITLAVNEGHVFPAIKGYEPLGPAGECWTNAYNYAHACGLRYAEGVALMPNGWHAHAWCVTDDGAVIEPTLGYNHATEYRGWELDLEAVTAVMTTSDTAPHSSFLEAGIGSGAATWPEIKERFCAIPGTT